MNRPEREARFDAPVRHVGVVLRHRSAELADVLARLRAVCEARGVTLAVEDTPDVPRPDGFEPLDVDARVPDLLVSLGGDGTLLRAARSVVDKDVPVMGVNLGHLGFLTTAAVSDMETALEAVLEGRAFLDRRVTLHMDIVGEDGAVRGPASTGLNDVVVHKPGVARVVHLDLAVESGGELDQIGSFAADGVILATPTGSTAYSLSAGGPIVVPEVDSILITPICPHSLGVRPLVVPGHTRVSIRPVDATRGLSVTVDGQVARELDPADHIRVFRSPHALSLVRLAGQTFFGTMRRKLSWAARGQG